MSKFLILGAGVYQVPLIKKAKQMGHYTIVCSIKGNYPGFGIADKVYFCDITNSEQCIDIAKNECIDAVLTTGSDVGIPTLSLVAKEMGIPGPNYEAAVSVTYKSSFRAFQHENDLNSPDYFRSNTLTDCYDFYRGLDFITVLKPDDSSGSRGVSIIEPKIDLDKFRNLFKYSQKFSRNGIVCIEEFIDGTEIGGDAFLINGDLVFFTTTKKHLDGVLVRGHTLPNDIPIKELTVAKEELEKTCNKLKYLNGPVNFDIILSKSKAYILEMGLRNGGNGIIDLIKYYYNVDLMHTLIDFSLNKPIKLALNIDYNNSSISSYVFGSDKQGIINNMTSLVDLKKKVPEIIDIIYAKSIGDQVEPFTNNANLIGYILIESGLQEYGEICKKIKSEFWIDIKNQYNMEL
jgi:biotin carboxylase